MTTSPTCIQCGSKQTGFYDYGPLRRPFWQCSHCYLLFTTTAHHPSRKIEKARYQTHNNSPDEPGYVEFLNQAVQPALPLLRPGMQGLDYGCGPGPTIAVLLERHGIYCHNYDPYFFPEWKQGPFDFIFCTETIEHFFNPRKELIKIDTVLKPGALLIVMTKFWKKNEDFSAWAYARDITHVCFFHEKTMEFVASTYNWGIIFNDHERIIIFRKAY